MEEFQGVTSLWIDAGNVTKNRGANLPGNQVMFKRMSRVYFGFPANDVPENSRVGDVKISFKNNDFKEFSLTYSDNKMDKLVLPIPGDGGPESYDKKVLHFRKIGLRRFKLEVHQSSQISKFRKKSEAVDGAFKMKSGREWGVF